MNNKKLSSSPHRSTFQLKRYLENCEAKAQEPNKDYLEMFETIKIDNLKKEQDVEWQQNNLEYDLRSTDWILQKVRQDEVYAQNLYAAMCNNSFQKNDVVPRLANQHWHCSWRAAGGIVADMRGTGDYIDWYCSGIRDSYSSDTCSTRNYARESEVTLEIKQDLFALGWLVISDQE